MSCEAPTDTDAISDEELTEMLADAEMTTPEAIERGADELEIASPEKQLLSTSDALIFAFQSTFCDLCYCHR